MTDAPNTTPRRLDRDRMVPAELAITRAIEIVVVIGTDPRLTDAVGFLAQARDKVADYVDEVDAQHEKIHAERKVRS